MSNPPRIGHSCAQDGSRKPFDGKSAPSSDKTIWERWYRPAQDDSLPLPGAEHFPLVEPAPNINSGPGLKHSATATNRNTTCPISQNSVNPNTSKKKT